MGDSGKIAWPRLLEITIGAIRHVLEKHMKKGYWPVGFSIVYYNKDAPPGKRWYYDMRNIINSHEVDFSNPKLQERINLVNEFLAEGCKRILEGEIDDLMIDTEKISDDVFQVPGVKGRA